MKSCTSIFLNGGIHISRSPRRCRQLPNHVNISLFFLYLFLLSFNFLCFCQSVSEAHEEQSIEFPTSGIRAYDVCYN